MINSIDLFLVFVNIIICLCLFFLQKVYKRNYEKARGSSINYCDTPKFQMDSVLKKFTDVSVITFHWFSLSCFVKM